MTVVYKITESLTGFITTYIGTISDIFSSLTMDVKSITVGMTNIMTQSASLLNSHSFFIGGSIMLCADIMKEGFLAYYDTQSYCTPYPLEVDSNVVFTYLPYTSDSTDYFVTIGVTYTTPDITLTDFA